MRWLVVLVMVGVFGISAAAPAYAQQYPDRTIRIIAPFGPGSNSTTLGMIIAEEVQKKLGVPVVVDSRPGAGGQIATESALHADSDGYTLVIATSGTVCVIPALSVTAPYDPTKDLEAVAFFGISPLYLAVNTDVTDGGRPILTFADLISYGKKHPGLLIYGYGNPTAELITTDVLSKMGVNAVPVPYKSEPVAVPDLMSGRVHFMFMTYSVLAGQLNSGKLRVLAVVGNRSPVLPEVPTLKEAGLKDWPNGGWVGLMVRSGTPKGVVEKISDVIGEILSEQSVRAKIEAFGIQPEIMSPSIFSAFVAEEIKRYRTAVEKNNFPRR